MLFLNDAVFFSQIVLHQATEKNDWFMIHLYSGAMSIVPRRILLRFADTSRLLVTMAPNQLRLYPSISSRTSVDHCYRLRLSSEHNRKKNNKQIYQF